MNEVTTKFSYPQFVNDRMGEKPLPLPAWTPPKMLTIKETAEEFKGSGMTEYFIRLGVKQNKFPYVKAGRKVLINRSVFMRYLNGELPTKER